SFREEQSPVEEVEEIQVSAPKKPNQRRQPTPKKKSQNEKSEDQSCYAWTHEEEIVLCKGGVRVSEDSVVGNVRKKKGFWVEVMKYMHGNCPIAKRQTYDMVNGKWKTVRPKVAIFCGVYANTIRTYTSGAGDANYIQRALTNYQVKEEKKNKRYKSSGSSSFNTRESGEGSINLNSTVGDEEDEVQEVRPRRPIGRDQAEQKAKPRSSSAGSANAFDLEPMAKMMANDDSWRRWEVGKNVKSGFPSIWLDIVHEMDMLKKQDIDIINCIKTKLGNGENIAFWEDVWHGDNAFKELYPRMYALETCKVVDVATKLAHSSLESSFRRVPRGGVEQEQYKALMDQVHDVSLVPMRARQIWSLESSGDFSVASVRKLIDDKMLPKVATKTRWIKFVPIKVNVLAWKVRLDSLPTRLNISRRGMDIDSITCPICDNGVESTNHLFFTCHIASEISRKISSWWDVSYMEISSYEDWLTWIVNLRLHIKHKQALEGVFYIMWWHVWSFRNKRIFGSKNPSMAMIFEDVVSR
ncbi:RNA-directed DNA polymerase, eukaryota, reverse transcriptase zinc-binding domain protein, partial [Tanacetum coccineum]